MGGDEGRPEATSEPLSANARPLHEAQVRPATPETAAFDPELAAISGVKTVRKGGIMMGPVDFATPPRIPSEFSRQIEFLTDCSHLGAMAVTDIK